MDQLAEVLTRHGVSRCDRRELCRYRTFYLTYSKIVESLSPQFKTIVAGARKTLRSAQPTGEPAIAETTSPQSGIAASELINKLSFSHISELLPIDDPLKRAFYEIECVRGNWAVRELKRQIASLYFERSGLSYDKAKLARLAHDSAELEEPRLTIRDPYIFEFVGLKAGCQ